MGFPALTSTAAAGWYTLLDWETPSCVESGGHITNGPIGELFEYRNAENVDVVIAYRKSSGKMGGVYFRSLSACHSECVEVPVEVGWGNRGRTAISTCGFDVR